MARIRTIKPEIARHEKLFELEQEAGLPMRFVWAVLPTVCDREGRFKWRPRSLKLDVLPYDEVDFSRVLHAFVTRGFLVKYRVGDAWYGCIPTFRKHQSVNNKENDSDLPGPDAAEEIITEEKQEDADASTTREARDDDANVTPLNLDQGEGKGREGERKGKDSTADAEKSGEDFVFEGNIVRLKRKNFDEWRRSFEHVPDLTAEIAAADAYYTDNPLQDPSKWFFAVSNWLKRANERAIKEGGSADDDVYRGVL